MAYTYTNSTTGQVVESAQRRHDLARWARWVETEQPDTATAEGTEQPDTTAEAEGEQPDAPAEGEQPDSTPAEGAEHHDDESIDGTPVDRMTVAQLDALAQQRGIVFASDAKKADKIAALLDSID